MTEKGGDQGRGSNSGKYIVDSNFPSIIGGKVKKVKSFGSFNNVLNSYIFKIFKVLS